MDTTKFDMKLVVCLDNAKNAREVINRLNSIGYFTADAYKDACDGIAEKNFPAKYHFLFDDGAAPSPYDALRAFGGIMDLIVYLVDADNNEIAEISYF